MIDIEISAEGNISLDSTGDIKRVSDGAEVAQACRIALQAWIGEYFLDQGFGVDYENKIFKRPYKLARVDREIRRVLKAVDGIKSIPSINLSLNESNEITGEIDIITIYGQDTVIL